MELAKIAPAHVTMNTESITSIKEKPLFFLRFTYIAKAYFRIGAEISLVVLQENEKLRLLMEIKAGCAQKYRR